MPLLVGILALIAVGVFYYRHLRPFVRSLVQARTVQLETDLAASMNRLIPVAEILRREKKAALIVLTILLLVVTAGMMVLAKAVNAPAMAPWIIGGGAAAILAALWSPWAAVRILASL